MSGKAEIAQVEKLIAHMWELRDHLRDDPHRPAYHFVPPAAWMNDINGSIYWKGRYHILYQHNPTGGYWDWMQWGHASSVDLVHWVHHPIALTPSDDGGDRAGCFSGGAFVSKEGVPTFIYYGLNEGICIASSEDDMLIHWTKHPGNPVIPSPQPGDPDCQRYTLHDPCAWLDGDTYYAAVNRSDPQSCGDGAYLFKSQDLADWEFVDLFYESDRRWTHPDEDCAVPDFFPLGDKHMLLFCSHLIATQYYLGRLEGEKFIPEIHERMAWSAGQLGGPRTLLDAQGRRIFFDWIKEVRDPDLQRSCGWSGAMTLPRVLSLADDGTLRIAPAPEVEVLRMNPRTLRNVKLAAGIEQTFDDIRGDCLELAITLESQGAAEFGVKVRCSPDGAEQTAITCDPTAGTLSVHFGESTLDEHVKYMVYRSTESGRADMERMSDDERFVSAQVAPFTLVDGEPLQLRIFVDRSVLEVYANGRQCITQRIYPTRSDSVDVRLFSNGGASIARSIEAWSMAPAH